MSVSYEPLWHRLLSAGMNKTQFRLQLGITTTTLARLGKNEYVSMEIIDKICQHFGCRIEDVVEIELENAKTDSDSTQT